MRWPSCEAGTHNHHVAGRTGDRPACITTRPFRAPHRTLSALGLIGGGQVPMLGDVSLAHKGIRFSTHGRSAAATSWRSCAGRSRRVLRRDDLPRVLDLAIIAALAALAGCSPPGSGCLQVNARCAGWTRCEILHVPVDRRVLVRDNDGGQPSYLWSNRPRSSWSSISRSPKPWV
jgi:Magnesium chelatase, subunit ChlI